MKRILLTSCIALGAMLFGTNVQAQYQINNSDFENWEDVSGNGKTGQEPISWNSFLTGTGSSLSMAGYNQVEKSTEIPTNGGTYCAKITARKVLASIIAQGNLTTGCINMGSITATDATGNYNYTNTNVAGQNHAFNGIPDSLAVWINFSGVNPGKISATIHTDGYYQDPEANNITATVVGSAINQTFTSTNKWVRMSIPFTYNSIISTPAYALVSFATSATAGKGNASDYMYIDNLNMIYNSQLSSLSINGTSVANFDKDTYEYTVDGEYDASQVLATADGVGATIEQSYDSSKKLLTITVSGNDISSNADNKHVYTVAYKYEQSFSGSLVVDIYDIIEKSSGKTTPINQPIKLLYNSSSIGTVDLSLEEFCLDGMKIGNIKVTEVAIADNNGIQELTKEQTIQITAGTKYPENEYAGPMLGDIPVVVSAKIKGEGVLSAVINIDMEQMLGQLITVSFSPYQETVENSKMVITGYVDAEGAPFILAGLENSASIPAVIDMTGATVAGAVTSDQIKTNMVEGANNMIIYAAEGATLSGDNAVVGASASNIVLTNEAPFVYFKNFTADAASFTLIAADKKNSMISLPFSGAVVPENVTVSQYLGVALDWNYNHTFYKPFIAFDAPATVLGDYAPYKAVVSGDGNRVFSATNAEFTNPAQKDAANGLAKDANSYLAGYNFELTMAETTVPTGSYVLDGDGVVFKVSDNTLTVPAFSAYLKDVPADASQYTELSINDNGTVTSVEGVAKDDVKVYGVNGAIVYEAESAMQVNIYNSIGMLVKVADVTEGKNVISIESGIYFVNNTSVIVK